MYKILSIDGGGIRGIITVIMIEKICELSGYDWLNEVNLFAGTSTGGLIALALASGKKLEDIQKIYQDDGKIIFHKSFWNDVGGAFGFLKAPYDIANLEKCLKNRLGETNRLSDLKKKVLIATFNLDGIITKGGQQYRTWKPKIFHNFTGNDSDEKALVYKVGIYTSAAPTYFQTYEGYIDGGVYASNPSMCALAQTQDPIRFDAPSPRFDQIRMLSLGTGAKLVYIEGDKNWGKLPWVTTSNNVIDIMMDGTNDIADYQVQQILGANSYFRLAPVFAGNQNFAMDDVDKIPEMIDFARSHLKPESIQNAADWIKNHWFQNIA